MENLLPDFTSSTKLLNGELIVDELKNVTLLYSDIKGFTPLSSNMHPQKLCALLDLVYSAFDKHLSHFGLYKVDTIGDAFVVVGGLPGYDSYDDHALKCVQFGLHMLRDLDIIKEVCM